MNSSARSWRLETSQPQPSSLWSGMRTAFAQLIGAGEQRLEATGGGAGSALLVVGSLDKRVAAELKLQAKAMAEAEGPSWSIDLSRVASWDSDGLAALVYALDVSDLAGKQLTLANPCAGLRHTLERSQLHHLFTIVQTDEPGH